MSEVVVKASKEVAEVLEQYTKAWNRGDAAGVAALYHEDAWLADQPLGGVVTGRAAIQAALQGFMDMGLKTFRGNIVDSEEYGDHGHTVTEWELLGSDGQHLASGTALAVGVRERGVWKVLRHWSVAKPEGIPPQ